MIYFQDIALLWKYRNTFQLCHYQVLKYFERTLTLTITLIVSQYFVSITMIYTILLLHHRNSLSVSLIFLQSFATKDILRTFRNTFTLWSCILSWCLKELLVFLSFFCPYCDALFWQRCDTFYNNFPMALRGFNTWRTVNIYHTISRLCNGYCTAFTFHSLTSLVSIHLITWLSVTSVPVGFSFLFKS